MQKQVNRFSAYIPRLTVFVSSACIMIIEIVAGRMIARYLGATLYVWTSVIGVVLGGIAIGNYIGGKIADRKPARKSLAVLFGLSSVACVLTVLFNTLIGGWDALTFLPHAVRSFLHVALVFLLPSTLLGTISPVIAKIALDLGMPQGNTIGSIYAWGAAGSIFGTFLAGFVLIALIGTQAIVWAVGAMLLILGIVYWFRFIPFYPWTALFLILALLGVSPFEWASKAGETVGLRPKHNPRVLYEKESEYCYIAVEQLLSNPDTREFVQDDQKSHSRIVMNDIENLQYTYIRIFAAAADLLFGKEEGGAFLSIGGGGFVFPRYLEARFPSSRIDAVEIDPAVTEAARAAFGLSDSSGIAIHNEDARNYVNALYDKKRRGNRVPAYDLVFGDAYGASFVPFQLVTKEYNDSIKAILTESGAYVVNMIDLYTSGAFLGTFINTMKKTFPHVYVISENLRFFLGSNFVVIGSNREIDTSAFRKHPGLSGIDVWLLDIYQTNTLLRKSGGAIFTDDYAPVEQLFSPFVAAHAKYTAAQKLIAKGNGLYAEGKKNESIRVYEETARLTPEMSIILYSKIGEVYAELEDWDNVIASGREAIEYNKRSPERINVAEIYFTVGALLLNLQRREEGLAYIRQAISDFKEELAKNSDSPDILFNIGNAFMYTGEINEAQARFEAALGLDESNVEVRLSCAISLLVLERYDEAYATVKKGVSMAAEKGDYEGTARLKEFIDNFEENKKKYSAL